MMERLADELRRRTSHEHRSIDRALFGAGVVDDLDRYAAFLRGLVVLHRDAEGRLAGHRFVEQSGHRPKSELAVDDLRRLGLVGPDRESGVGATALTDVRPEAAATVDDATVVGELYVIEGSTMGGRHLARLVRRRVPEAAAATAFLDAYGDAVDERWKATREMIDASGVDPDAASAAAVSVFRRARSLLCGVPA